VLDGLICISPMFTATGNWMTMNFGCGSGNGLLVRIELRMSRNDGFAGESSIARVTSDSVSLTFGQDVGRAEAPEG